MPVATGRFLLALPLLLATPAQLLRPAAALGVARRVQQLLHTHHQEHRRRPQQRCCMTAAMDGAPELEAAEVTDGGGGAVLIGPSRRGPTRILTREEAIALPPEERWMRVEGPVEVVYSDAHIVVVNKPSGLLSVPGVEVKDSLVTRVAVMFGQERIDKMVVHRLDQATSGLLVFARSDAALRQLHEDFRLRRVRKRYVAVVHGAVGCDCGEVDIPIRKDMDSPPLQLADPIQGKPSLTLWSVTARTRASDGAAATTRVELTPVTGRSHQLRLHMKLIGHPILGDDLYAHEEARVAAPRCLLHAQQLSFRHPVTGEDMSFRLPPEF